MPTRRFESRGHGLFILRIALSGCVLMIPGLVHEAVAESKLLFDLPDRVEDLEATTFDDAGHEIGHSSFKVETSPTGIQHLRIEIAVAAGGTNRSEAILAPVAGRDGRKDQLRLVEERSQATRPDGVSLERLVVDHARGRASCFPFADTDEGGKHIELPSDDRVVNVPLQLLFQPLAMKKVERVRFQIVLCRSGPFVQKMVAVQGPESRHQGLRSIEIRYGPDFGDTLAWFASRVLPSFSFWLDERQGEYLAHRMPLYRNGPRILVVRDGLMPPDLGIRVR